MSQDYQLTYRYVFVRREETMLQVKPKSGKPSTVTCEEILMGKGGLLKKHLDFGKILEISTRFLSFKIVVKLT